MKLVAPLVISNIDQISPLKAAAKMPAGVPLLVLTGTADQRALVAESQAICDCCNNHAQLIIIQGGDHLKLMETDESAYRKAVLKFIGKCNLP
jgi:alpha-beta hydrolase superfamily lysophospholipase